MVFTLGRDAGRLEGLRRRGAEGVTLDVRDSEGLREVLSRGDRLFLLNPPAPPAAADSEKEERGNVAAILEALGGSRLERIVAQSTYGARPGERIGDLGVLWEMEQKLAARAVPHRVLRAAYFMSNWDASLETARAEGKLYSLFPTDFELPMVAPSDIGSAATSLLMEPDVPEGVHHVEGPARYSANDAAEAFADALGKRVKAESIPVDRWESRLRQMGFSDKAAESMARMTKLTLEEKYQIEGPLLRGETTLSDYIAGLVAGDS